MEWTSLGEAEGMDLSAKDLEITLNVLQHLADHPTRMNSQERLRSLIIKIYKQHKKQQKQRNQQLKASQQKPLIKTIDGMARIYDPIVQGIQNPSEPLFGHFLKNYVPSPW
ncbi:hypothetical protein [Planktothrix pseudagardhii]|uniref:Short chain dehydrogenase/reductase family oxidoreductase n=1 Tax=Planktothrix pseudagardhii TaxID=132604 RepID=A0A9W4CRW7_9CYAN|nr:hypothetical protein [Planktothrix pseudagardhii]CAD5979377.1 Short chain dehydrogenase/reductase family oxidoreductase [Planktothrix pseudagardhii]